MHSTSTCPRSCGREDAQSSPQNVYDVVMTTMRTPKPAVGAPSAARGLRGRDPLRSTRMCWLRCPYHLAMHAYAYHATFACLLYRGAAPPAEAVLPVAASRCACTFVLTIWVPTLSRSRHSVASMCSLSRGPVVLLFLRDCATANSRTCLCPLSRKWYSTKLP